MLDRMAEIEIAKNLSKIISTIVPRNEDPPGFISFPAANYSKRVQVAARHEKRSPSYFLWFQVLVISAVDLLEPRQRGLAYYPFALIPRQLWLPHGRRFDLAEIRSLDPVYLLYKRLLMTRRSDHDRACTHFSRRWTIINQAPLREIDLCSRIPVDLATFSCHV